MEYLEWLVKRIRQLRPEASYQPTIQIDVYGTIGQAFGAHNISGMADYLEVLEETAKPFKLRIEVRWTPVTAIPRSNACLNSLPK